MTLRTITMSRTSHTGRPTTEPTMELREEHRSMSKRLARLKTMAANTPPRRQSWALKCEIEVLRANIAAMERRYCFDSIPDGGIVAQTPFGDA